MSQKLFSTYTTFNYIKNIIYRILIVVGIGYLSFHYEENPNLITVLYIILGLLFFIIGDKQLEIYVDRIRLSTPSLYSLIFRSKSKTYFLNDIEKVYMDKLVPSDNLEVGVAVILYMLLPKRRTTHESSNPIYFELKDGTTITYYSDMNDIKNTEIVFLVNKLLK